MLELNLYVEWVMRRRDEETQFVRAQMRREALLLRAAERDARRRPARSLARRWWREPAVRRPVPTALAAVQGGKPIMTLNQVVPIFEPEPHCPDDRAYVEGTCMN